MALELRQQLKLTQQLIMTPQLQMAIKLLQLSRLELMDTVRKELEENPALEEVPEGPRPNNSPISPIHHLRTIQTQKRLLSKIDFLKMLIGVTI